MMTACIYLGAVTPDHSRITFGSDRGEMARYQMFRKQRGLGTAHKIFGG